MVVQLVEHPVASLRLVSPSAATYGVALFFPLKKLSIFLVTVL